MTQRHQRHSLYQQPQHIGQCRYSPNIHQLPHFLPNFLFTLYTSGLSPQQPSSYIKPSLIYQLGLLHTYHDSLLQRK